MTNSGNPYPPVGGWPDPEGRSNPNQGYYPGQQGFAEPNGDQLRDAQNASGNSAWQAYPPTQSYPSATGYPQPGVVAYNVQPQHPNGTPAMVVGIIALALGLMCGVGFLGSPVALGLGLSGNRQVRENPGRWAPTGSLTAGVILGAIGTGLLAIGLIVVFFLYVLAVIPHHY